MQVKIVNNTPQLLVASVHDAQGVLHEIKLGGREASEPVDDVNLSTHTRQLIERGHLKLRAVPA